MKLFVSITNEDTGESSELLGIVFRDNKKLKHHELKFEFKMNGTGEENDPPLSHDFQMKMENDHDQESDTEFLDCFYEPEVEADSVPFDANNEALSRGAAMLQELDPTHNVKQENTALEDSEEDTKPTKLLVNDIVEAFEHGDLSLLDSLRLARQVWMIWSKVKTSPIHCGSWTKS